MKETHTDNSLDDFEKKIKAKINFQNMLDRNIKKNENTPVSDLIRSTTQTVLPKDEFNSQQNKIDTSAVTEKLDRLEGLVQSLIINQQTMKSLIPENIPSNDKSLEVDQLKEVIVKSNENQKKLILNSLIILSIVSVTTAYILSNTNKKSRELVVTPAPIAKVVETPTYITTKYLNMRTIASTKGEIQLVIPPNSRIKIIEEKGDWKLINFKDYVKNTEYKGWVYGENLKKI
ncbi:SH3 domain-containing protein [Bacteriovorax sp. Seq25_V]|uniref:SH3 domain-containing protein n=1 Tax=Bacteriovorax sp. Seq25_V TaxID=1201288 RepID=UPI00038A06D6|nr:SH3 domain-containing protein [Bacteriovorax sp. Seq25_V]EQC47994.1 SH3 domain protein [Bacteriovorax sp. Seq25_V]